MLTTSNASLRAMENTLEYPVSLDLDAPLGVARWRPLVQWFLAMPHFLVLYALSFLLTVMWLIALVTVVFTARIPPGIFGFMTTIHRYQWRVTSYANFMREDYPPFDFLPAAIDPSNDPARLSIQYPDRLSRFMPFIKWLLALPHFLVLIFLDVGYLVVLVVAFFAVIITGAWPAGMRRYLIGVTRWTTRVQAYVYLMTDAYPPFRLG